MSRNLAGCRFAILPGLHAICRLKAGSPVPRWAKGTFVSITATADELSIMCPAEQVPAAIRAERDWRVIKVLGPFLLDAVGVLASLAVPLAAANISMLAVATFDTDYILVKADDLAVAVAALARSGHKQI